MSSTYTGSRRFGRTVRSNWRPLFVEVTILLFVVAATFVAILSGIHAAKAAEGGECLTVAFDPVQPLPDLGQISRQVEAG